MIKNVDLTKYSKQAEKRIQEKIKHSKLLKELNLIKYYNPKNYNPYSKINYLLAEAIEGAKLHDNHIKRNPACFAYVEVINNYITNMGKPYWVDKEFFEQCSYIKANFNDIPSAVKTGVFLLPTDISPQIRGEVLDWLVFVVVEKNEVLLPFEGVNGKIFQGKVFKKNL